MGLDHTPFEYAFKNITFVTVEFVRNSFISQLDNWAGHNSNYCHHPLKASYMKVTYSGIKILMYREIIV